MSEPNDMDAPVTRRELAEVLAETLKAYPTRDEMFAELARHFGAMREWFADAIRASLDPYRGRRS